MFNQRIKHDQLCITSTGFWSGNMSQEETCAQRPGLCHQASVREVQHLGCWCGILYAATLDIVVLMYQMAFENTVYLDLFFCCLHVTCPPLKAPAMDLKSSIL